ncbi:MAG: chemotaxis protein CheC [Candidatus Thorarchaeota archaeon]
MRKKRKKYRSMEITLEPKQVDILKKLGNIGSGNAIKALSKLLSHEIEVSLTSVDIIPFWRVYEMFDIPNISIFGIYSKISYTSDLAIIQIFSKESTINLLNSLSGYNKILVKDINVINDLDEFSYSIISEIGNILTGSYANALADLLSIKLIPTVPKIALDTLNALLNGIIAKFSQFSDYLILIKTIVRIPDMNIQGLIGFIPSMTILEEFFSILNIKYNLNL